MTCKVAGDIAEWNNQFGYTIESGMYIKKILIRGFKSFEGCDLETVSHINAVVGRNGSGKSNLVSAIRYVLCDPSLRSLTVNARRSIIHEGLSVATVNAFVEIILDNKDRRFPCHSDEVRIRRVIGAKKDEFYINEKHVQQHEVVCGLQASGFSLCNPYHVVQQGKITKIASVEDDERLELLKGVAGVKVYEEKQEQSRVLLESSERTKIEVKAILDMMESRLETLQSEKEELDFFLQQDAKRRGLERVLIQSEIDEVDTQLKRLETDTRHHVDRLESLYTRFEKLFSVHSSAVDSLTQAKRMK